jgi:hypothetical protein
MAQLRWLLEHAHRENGPAVVLQYMRVVPMAQSWLLVQSP